MPRKKQPQKEVLSEKTIEDLGVFNPFQKTEYKETGRISISSLDAVEKYDPVNWCVNDEHLNMKDEPYVIVVGEFWYCGYLYDGKILYPLLEFKEFMDLVKPKVKVIENDILYFAHPLSKSSFNKMYNLEIFVRLIGTEFSKPNDDQIFLKI